MFYLHASAAKLNQKFQRERERSSLPPFAPAYKPLSKRFEGWPTMERQPSKRRNEAPPPVPGTFPIYIVGDSNTEEPSKTRAQVNIITKREDFDSLAEYLLPLNMLKILGVSEICIMVSQPKNKDHIDTLFYMSPIIPQIEPDNILDLQFNEELSSSYSLNMDNEAKLIRLL